MLRPILGVPASFHSSCLSAMPDLSITWLRLQQGEFSGHKYRRVEGETQELSGGITGVRKRHGELGRIKAVRYFFRQRLGGRVAAGSFGIDDLFSFFFGARPFRLP